MSDATMLLNCNARKKVLVTLLMRLQSTAGIAGGRRKTRCGRCCTRSLPSRSVPFVGSAYMTQNKSHDVDVAPTLQNQ